MKIKNQFFYIRKSFLNRYDKDINFQNQLTIVVTKKRHLEKAKQEKISYFSTTMHSHLIIPRIYNKEVRKNYIVKISGKNS